MEINNHGIKYKKVIWIQAVQSLGGEKSLGEGNGNLLQYSCLENPTHRGAWWAIDMELQRVGHNLATKPPHLSSVQFSHSVVSDSLLQWPKT